MAIGDVNSDAKGSGARFNDGKPDWSLLPMWTLEDELRVWMYGREKYAAWNWAKGMPWSVPFACLMRHMAAWQAGEECDKESGLPHLAHAMCNLRMLTLYAQNYREGDDRPPACAQRMPDNVLNPESLETVEISPPTVYSEPGKSRITFHVDGGVSLSNAAHPGAPDDGGFA
jgi:hypothetical protein